MVKSVGIVRQDMVKSGDLCWQVDRAESEVEDPCMRLLMGENELAKVTVERNEDTLVSNGNGQDLRIVKGWSIVDGYEGNIVAATSKIWGDASIGALVDEKPHGHVLASCAAPRTRRGRAFRDRIA